VTADLTVKLADLGEARSVDATSSDCRPMPRLIYFVGCYIYITAIMKLLSSSPDHHFIRQLNNLSSTSYYYSITRNINWSSPEILNSFQSHTVVDQSADVWSLMMVISEIFSGEIPFDSDLYRQMRIEALNSAIQEGHRPKIPSRFLDITWLNKLVSTIYCYILT